ncbi:helix-turn-helix transcriptional regulator [Moritella sp.]|uniref:AraC family transcriptional regulator n=1 Tax=Moritella sp. TaxID=78556 RepID=UPI001DFDE992|nr:helix-turn-helix transcriptional regulator [Moritella sp.]MCJ8349586.1 helix-turn-helix transcriptional regulator [Moritella sp.]NQZ41510.1 helix-turn-helix transcriptional regulator [Moritella sp.]
MPTSQNLSANTLITQHQHAPALINTIEMHKGFIDKLHQHHWHQLIFPIRGLIQTEADDYQFLVPHTTAIFIPAGVDHESIAITDTTFIGLYINPDYGRCYTRNAGQQLKQVSMTSFLKELILMIKQQCQLEPALSHDNILRLLEVLYDQIHTSESFKFKLLIPEDRRIKVIFERLTAQPELDFTLSKWGRIVGASERTLSRIFAKEFNTSFALWRQHLRLIQSLSLLESELSIQSVAHQVGYQNDSSYIKAFKARFAMTPQQFRTRNHRIYVE